jgi:type II secretory pathway predicted ATPase ExeA
MLTEVMAYYGLARDIRAAGYYETEHHRQICQQVRAVLPAGRLIAVTGIVGSGKTVMLRRLQDELAREGKVLVSKSLSVDKERTTLAILIAALFYDLSPDKDPRIPTQGEKRERELRDLVKRGRKPVVLFVDEAHDLHGKTLTGLKRLMEVAADGGGTLSIVLAGHPKLRNDLRRPTLEEIGYRTDVFSFEGMAGHQRDYITWLLGSCAAEGVHLPDMIEADAIDLVAGKLKTPLQIEQHLTLTFEEGFRVGEKPVTADVVQSVLSRHLEDLEPKLTRHGYTVRSLVEPFNAKPAEIRLFLRGELDANRTRELSDRMVAAGLPI